MEGQVCLHVCEVLYSLSICSGSWKVVKLIENIRKNEILRKSVLWEPLTRADGRTDRQKYNGVNFRFSHLNAAKNQS
jgi:hypothetical protein